MNNQLKFRVYTLALSYMQSQQHSHSDTVNGICYAIKWAGTIIEKETGERVPCFNSFMRIDSDYPELSAFKPEFNDDVDYLYWFTRSKSEGGGTIRIDILEQILKFKKFSKYITI